MTWLQTIRVDIWSWLGVLALLNIGGGGLGLLLLIQPQPGKDR